MNRRHFLWIIVLLVLSGMLLTPWMTAPPSSLPAKGQPEGAAQPSPLPQVSHSEPVRIRVAAALGEEEFAALQHSAEDAVWNIEVEWERVDPLNAFEVFKREAQKGTAADVMLMPGEWVKNFAVSGLLAPADGAYSSDAQSRQFAALTAPLKWNGYIWGVPRDFDPYVLVWNTEALQGDAGRSVDLPESPDGWAELAAMSRSAASPAHWLVLDMSDPLSLLAWVQAFSGERSDTIWEDENAWSKSLRRDALALLDREREKAVFASGTAEIEEMVAEGRAAAAVLPYSAGKRLLAASPSSSLMLDFGTWQHPHVWPRSISYTIYAGSNVKEAATRWIAAATSESSMLALWTESGKLPAHASLYVRDDALTSVFPKQSSDVFPYAQPAYTRPWLPQQLDQLAVLWKDFASGAIGYDGWLRRWSEVSADFEFHR